MKKKPYTRADAARDVGILYFLFAIGMAIFSFLILNGVKHWI